ncbi:hypothetical protein RDI58_010461 [Solanum bulbocastanum]|uniref:NAC domain-containing protein n=1 Tax=Solanum bulbocastanum TaxID=147425 RepID=A0AAN8YG13_SOLBU
MPIEYNDIPYINLYGNKEPGELFQNSGNDHVNYFFIQLKRKTIKGKNFNRSIVRGRKWKGRDNSKEIVDKERSRIGYKKTFRFDEESSSASEDKESVYSIVKEYCLDKTTMDVLRECGEIRHEDSVMCFITKKARVLLGAATDVGFLNSFFRIDLDCRRRQGSGVMLPISSFWVRSSPEEEEENVQVSFGIA